MLSSAWNQSIQSNDFLNGVLLPLPFSSFLFLGGRAPHVALIIPDVSFKVAAS